ncbi:MAG: peptidylprolyl isomerase [Bacteroidota bacterium]|jgi:peptidyl-prolyl cis-trans isomerase SurA
MINRLILGITIIPILFLFGCGASNSTIATIGDEKITLNYFEDNYAKNNGGWDTSAISSIDDRQRFLDLLVKFKLKVKEARAQGLEKDSAIMSEMETYNTSIAQSYMIEKEVVEPGLQRFYDRKKDEVRASHILLRLTPNASPQDTLKVYERAMNIIAKIPQVPFDTLAFKYSEDPSAKTNYGNLGFFSSGRMVSEFEDACYSLKSGEHTKTPIRSQFGYHIIKVTAHQPNPGSVRISHILLRFKEGLTDTAAVRDTVWMIYHKLKSGASFADMVQKYSQDPKKAANNGDIGFYERDRLPPNVADVFYKMKIDSISEPMQFNYGYHIFKLTEKKEIPSFAEMQKDLKELYKQVRYPYEYNQYVQGLKVQYHVRIDSSVVRKLISSLDTTKISGSEGWKDTLSAEMLKTTIIHSIGKPFTINDFAENVITTNDLKSYILTPDNIWMLTNKLLDVAAVREHARHAAERYPVLASLLKEYEEGILLYRVEQDEIWKKVMVNDSLLKEYYNAHKEEYRWPERVNFAEIFTVTDSIAKAAYWKVQYGENFLDVAEEYTNRSGYQEKKGVWGFQPFATNDLSLKASIMAVDSVSEPFQYQSGWSIIKTLAKDSAHVKSFEDATAEVAGGYQEAATKQREQDWVEALKKKYPVTINKEVLTEAFKRKRVESQ